MSRYHSLIVYLALYCMAIFNLDNVATSEPPDGCTRINGMNYRSIIPDSSITVIPNVDVDRLRAGTVQFPIAVVATIVVDLSPSSSSEVELQSVNVHATNVKTIVLQTISNGKYQRVLYLTEGVSSFELKSLEEIRADRIEFRLQALDNISPMALTSNLDVRACFPRPGRVENLAIDSPDNANTYTFITWKCPLERQSYITSYELTSSIDVRRVIKQSANCSFREFVKVRDGINITFSVSAYFEVLKGEDSTISYYKEFKTTHRSTIRPTTRADTTSKSVTDYIRSTIRPTTREDTTSKSVTDYIRSTSESTERADTTSKSLTDSFRSTSESAVREDTTSKSLTDSIRSTSESTIDSTSTSASKDATRSTSDDKETDIVLPLVLSLVIVCLLIIVVIVAVIYCRRKRNLKRKKRKINDDLEVHRQFHGIGESDDYEGSAYEICLDSSNKVYENLQPKLTKDLKRKKEKSRDNPDKYENIDLGSERSKVCDSPANEKREENETCIDNGNKVYENLRSKLTKPVELENFSQCLKNLHRNANLLMMKEFEVLEDASPILATSIAKSGKHAKKNRNPIDVPFDKTRVKLRAINGNRLVSDYINASYIPGYSLQKEYIATQNPLNSSVEDFWTMVWQENVEAIIMLSDIDENFHQYWKEMTEVLVCGNLTIELEKIITLKKYNLKIFEMKKDDETRKVKHYHLSGWKGDRPTMFSEDVLSFLYDVYSDKPLESGPIVVHCRSGNGRSGTIIAVDICRHYIKNVSLTEEIDIFDIVLKMLHARPHIINLESQYGFIYDAVNVMIEQKKVNLETNYCTLNSLK